MRRALLALINAAGGDLEKARRNVEDWFDDTMDRVSGRYKRRMQVIMLILAFVASAALNADTIMVVNILSTNATVRTVIAAHAERVANEGTLPDNATVINQLQDSLQHLQFLGWSAREGDPRHLPKGWKLITKLAGVLVTTIAVALGAPFWFDALNKLVELRGTGKPPKRASELDLPRRAEG